MAEMNELDVEVPHTNKAYARRKATLNLLKHFILMVTP